MPGLSATTRRRAARRINIPGIWRVFVHVARIFSSGVNPASPFVRIAFAGVKEGLAFILAIWAQNVDILEFGSGTRREQAAGSDAGSLGLPFWANLNLQNGQPNRPLGPDLLGTSRDQSSHFHDSRWLKSAKEYICERAFPFSVLDLESSSSQAKVWLECGAFAKNYMYRAKKVSSFPRKLGKWQF